MFPCLTATLQSSAFSRKPFKHHAEDKRVSGGDCQVCLWKGTLEGAVAIRCQKLFAVSERSFETAKALQHEHFGIETEITAAYVETVHSWPAVEAESVSLPRDRCFISAWLQRLSVRCEPLHMSPHLLSLKKKNLKIVI